MKYPYHVKHNGVNYKPFEEIPDGVQTPVVTGDVAHENAIVETVNYSKTDINRMSLSDLRKLGEEQKIKGADGMSGSELKKLLIEKFGL